MTDAQMAFLAERRKAKVRDLSAQPGPSSSSSSQAVAPPEGASIWLRWRAWSCCEASLSCDWSSVVMVGGHGEWVGE